MVGDQAKCLYCERVFRKAFNLWEHSTGCVEITKLEETRKCEFCPKIFPESRSFFHQVQCDRNPARVVKPTDNVTCPKCKRTLPSTRAFRVHLGQKCLPKFKDLVQKSIDSCSKSTTANGDSKTPAATKVQKAKTVITRNRREVGQTTGAKRPGNMKSKPTCLFCGAIFGVPKSLKQHGIRCPEIEKIEKKRDCPHCKKTFAESRSYLHQVVCDLNLGKLPTPTMALNCPKCSSSLKSFLSYQHHLSTTCLQDLVGFFKQSIEKCTQNGRKSSQSQKKNSSAVRDKHDQMGEEISEDVPELAFSSTSESEAENDSDCEIVSYQNFEGRPDLQPIVRLVKMEPEPPLELRERTEEFDTVTDDVLWEDDEDEGLYGFRPINTTRQGQDNPEAEPQIVDNANDPPPEAIVIDWGAQDERNNDEEVVIESTSKKIKKEKSNDGDQQEQPLRRRETPGAGSSRPKPRCKKQQARVANDRNNPDLGGVGDSLRPPQASTSNLVTCPFCLAKFNDMKELRQHAVPCPGLKSYEPLETCDFCQVKLPVSICGLHERICSQNKHHFLPTEGNIK